MEKGKFHIEADASEEAIGTVLSQEQDRKWRPVAFLSKALTVTECNYEIYDKELLAIMLALDKWRHYLMGIAIDFEIWTVHQNLQYFRKPQKLNLDEAHERIKSATCDHQKWDQGIANLLNHKKGIQEKDGLLYYNKRIYVPCDHAVHGEIIMHCHDHIAAGHPEVKKTKELVLRDYWWPKLKKDIKTYV
ncbi:uncharacterized protein ARMOST_07004 [Armillaria ostoyae]|uniref:Reverse transcriptase RNase H-like domain-containing protein n=1 Tax=Armillaria ostoyae TaxID=47428 RepID=A0A284R4K6_ARMOS|nr:uncharacterized protein ARMOST_07004 [Armillaria ostoyae]